MGAVKFQLYQKVGRKEFSFAEVSGGGGIKGFGVVLTQELEALAILNRRGGGVHPLKLEGGGGGGMNSLSGLEAGTKC